MGFYDELSRYYDYIFPVSQAQLNMIRQTAGELPAKILDVACGSGGYSIELARDGYQVTGTDLDEEMLKKARKKAENEGLNIDFIRLDMKEMDKLPAIEFNCIFCIGNSLVHLGSLEEIKAAIKKMAGLIDHKGALILQTVNYDRILKYKVDSLPTIKNEEQGIEFVRKYKSDSESGLVSFNTILKVDKGGEKTKLESTIPLFPLESKDIIKILNETGFKNIELFGDFNYSPFGDDTFAMVIRAYRQN